MSAPIRCARHDNVLTECHYCCRVLGLAEYRPAGGAVVRTPAPVVPLPCVHEGPVVEFCRSCNAEARHVRACNHPAPSNPDRETCTRVRVGPAVQACANCPDYEASR